MKKKYPHKWFQKCFALPMVSTKKQHYQIHLGLSYTPLESTDKWCWLRFGRPKSLIPGKDGPIIFRIKIGLFDFYLFSFRRYTQGELIELHKKWSDDNE